MWSDLAAHAGQHLALSGAALTLAALAGIAGGVTAATVSRLRTPILGAAAVGRTLPSMAVLALLLPLIGVGILPAVAALTLLALPPLIVNVDLAIRGVPPAALDAASGMGMTAAQRFLRVIVPEALPVAVTGLRIATTEIIASATLATFVGAGGLGDDIVRGLQTDDTQTLLAGAVCVAALAFGADLLLAGAARAVGGST